WGSSTCSDQHIDVCGPPPDPWAGFGVGSYLVPPSVPVVAGLTPDKAKYRLARLASRARWVFPRHRGTTHPTRAREQGVGSVGRHLAGGVPCAVGCRCSSGWGNPAIAPSDSPCHLNIKD